MSDSPEEIILQGSAVSNKWCSKNKGPQFFSKPNWYDCPNETGTQIKEENRVNFNRIIFTDVSIHNAFAEGLHINNAIITNCHFEEGDFSRADFSNSTFRNTKFNKTILTDANFDGASFINCNLNRVNLTNARFCLDEIRETVVYGISAWDLHTCDKMKQSKLIIERTYELYSDFIESGKIPMMADNIELAQFIYYLSDHKKMRETINILNNKGILLLGQFKDGGIERLYKLREWLLERNYSPMIFDFIRPDNMDFTETIITMAGLSKIIIADLSGGSVPHELHATLTNFQKPLIAFYKEEAYSLIADLKRKNPFVFEIKMKDDSDLLAKIPLQLKQAEKGHAKIVRQLAKDYN